MKKIWLISDTHFNHEKLKTMGSGRPDAFEVIKSWGFKYHCLLTWDKTNGIPCWGFKRKTELGV